MTIKTVIGCLRERAKSMDSNDRRIMNEAVKRLEHFENEVELAYKTGFTEGYEAGLKATKEIINNG